MDLNQFLMFFQKRRPVMRIVALDLGKFNTVACLYDTQSLKHEFHTIGTTPKAFHDLFVEHGPDRVVIEISTIAGWVCDIGELAIVNSQ